MKIFFVRATNRRLDQRHHRGTAQQQTLDTNGIVYEQPLVPTGDSPQPYNPSKSSPHSSNYELLKSLHEGIGLSKKEEDKAKGMQSTQNLLTTKKSRTLIPCSRVKSNAKPSDGPRLRTSNFTLRKSSDRDATAKYPKAKARTAKEGENSSTPSTKGSYDQPASG